MEVKFENGSRIITMESSDVVRGNMSNYHYESFKIPKSFLLTHEDNAELIRQITPHIGRTLRMESDQINGLFNISEDDRGIVFNEVFE